MNARTNLEDEMGMLYYFATSSWQPVIHKRSNVLTGISFFLLRHFKNTS